MISQTLATSRRRAHAKMVLLIVLVVIAGALAVRQFTREDASGGSFVREDFERRVGAEIARTVREIASAVVGTDTAMGVLPMGSGNDFARSIGIPLDARKAVEVLRDGVARSVDVGEDSSGLFTCVAGIGFAAEVSHEASKSRLFRGSAAYFAGVFKALARLRPIRMRVQLDEESLDVEAVFVMAQNTPYCGGGQLMAPDAELDDGKLDVVIVGPVSRIELVGVFPRVYSGGHQHHPAVAIHRSSRIEVSGGGAIRKILDGDVVGVEALCARVSVAALRVIAPHVSKSSSPLPSP